MTPDAALAPLARAPKPSDPGALSAPLGTVARWTDTAPRSC
jgi:hypothetical protein